MEIADENLVSVVMTTYCDALPRLQSAVDSILAQSMSKLELLIAFEPGDENAEILPRTRPDPRLIIVKNPVRAGKAGSFNNGLDQARGRYIARMDSDDRAYPDRLEKQLQFLRKNPGITVLGGGIAITNDDGVLIANRRFAAGHDEIVRNFALLNAMCHPTVMWDRRLAGENLRYDPAFSVEDLELWFRLLSQGCRFANLPDPLIAYKQTAEWRRTRQNWRGNFHVRAHYWRMAFRHPPLILGIAAFAIFLLLPKPLIDRLTQRSGFSDKLRSIQSLPPQRQ